MNVLIVVDCQYDFIDGALACENAENAVKNIIEYINVNDNKNNNLKVFYSADWHNLGHCSFKVNNKGGTWPVHCVAGTRGAEIHKLFYSKINNINYRPDKHKNIYYKGCNDDKEQYSAFDAKNSQCEFLHKNIDFKHDNIIIAGIASEFCVRETVIAFLDEALKQNGDKSANIANLNNINILADALAWVNYDAHEKNLKNLALRGVNII